MPDTQLPDNSPDEGDNFITQQPPPPVYGVKFDVTLKKGGQTVEIKPYVYHVISALRNLAYDDQMMILDVNGIVIPPGLEGIRPEDMVPKFCAEIIGAHSNILTFGLKIRSTKLDFKELRTRTTDYFKKHSVYMKPHNVGFDFGVNWINVGFFMNTHPVYGQHESTAKWIIEEFNHSVENDQDYFTEARTAELANAWNERNPGTLFPEDKELPLAIQPNKVFARNSAGKTARTYAAALMAPAKFASVAQKILDYMVVSKNYLPNLIPIDCKNEHIDEYFALVQQHDVWMENHRNVQILNVHSQQAFTQIIGEGNMVLKDILQTIPTIYDASFDALRDRVNVSVMVADYIATIEQIDRLLILNKFPFNPFVKKPKAFRTIPTSGTNAEMSPKDRYGARLARLANNGVKGNEYQKMDEDAQGIDTTDEKQESTTEPSASTHQTSTETTKRRKQTTRKPRIQVVFSFSDVNEFPFLTKNGQNRPKQSKRKISKDRTSTDNSVSTNTTPTTRNSKAEQPTTKTSINSDRAGDRSDSPTNTVPSNTSGTLTAGSSSHEKTITDLRSTISTLTERHEKEIESMKAELQAFKKTTQDQTLQPMTIMLQQMQKQQEAMEQRMAKMDDLIAIFLRQHIASNAKASGELNAEEHPPVAKKPIRTGDYPTPTKYIVPDFSGFTTPTRTFRQPNLGPETTSVANTDTPRRKNYYADLQREEEEYEEDAQDDDQDTNMDDVATQETPMTSVHALTKTKVVTSAKSVSKSSKLNAFISSAPQSSILAFLNKTRPQSTPPKLEILNPKKPSTNNESTKSTTNPNPGDTPSVTSDPDPKSHRDSEH